MTHDSCIKHVWVCQTFVPSCYDCNLSGLQRESFHVYRFVGRYFHRVFSSRQLRDPQTYDESNESNQCSIQDMSRSQRPVEKHRNTMKHLFALEVCVAFTLLHWLGLGGGTCESRDSSGGVASAANGASSPHLRGFGAEDAA